MPKVRLTPQNFEVVSGNDKQLNVTVIDQDGVAVDITGATIVWGVSLTDESKSRIFFYTSPANITITSATAGKFRINILDTDTEPLVPQDYFHEARMVDTAGLKTTVMRGTMTVEGNITPA